MAVSGFRHNRSPKMAATMNLLLHFSCLVCMWDFSHSHVIKRVLLPHSASTGFVVTSLNFWGQTFNLSPSNRAGISRYFTVLGNGDVVTTSDVSQLLGSKLTLKIDNKLAAETWQESIHIDIQDANKMLVFPHQVYTGHIKENEPAGTLVKGLESIQAKFGPSRKKIHYALKGSEKKLFKLKEINLDGLRTVQVLTRKPLDREHSDIYNLMLEAWTIDQKDQPVLAKVKILVDDVNDNVPRFQKSEYHTVISDNTPALTTVTVVKATDPDEGKIWYHMTPHKLFKINPATGGVILKRGHNIGGQSYEMMISAEDQDGYTSKPVSLKVEVEGNLVFEPVVRHSREKRATRARKEVELPESMAGRLFGIPRQHQNDRFSLKEPAPEMLDINRYTGGIRLRDGQRLDYEDSPRIDFIVIISRDGDSSVYDEQPVRIRLTDVNDEVPRFVNAPRPFLATVSTNAAPGTSVYRLMARDDDRNSHVRYNLESGGEDRFEVDPFTGVVRTKGRQPFPAGKEYEIGVSATDKAAPTLQKSPTESLKILVGERDPQFFETLYEASVPETAPKQFPIVTIKAHSHQTYPITYELTTESGSQSNEYAIDQNTGVVDLLRRLDYEQDPQQYHLRVKSIENGRPPRTSTVNLIINLVDMNDNTPTFPLSQYIVQGIAENLRPGSEIVQVTATDRDSVTNAQLTYSVSDSNFTVDSRNNIGYIKTSRRLDYDFTPDHTYNFTVTAVDNGTPPRSGTAMVRVTVTNVNDEEPIFTQSIEHVQVSEDASSNTVIHVVQAYDPDGDGVTYSFPGGRLTEGPFEIKPNSGILTLKGRLDKSQVSYKLNVTATDNGGCCGGMTSRSSQGLVIVEVKDINNNAPRFPQCAEYKPVVLEKEDVGTPVIQVQAVDLDTGSNGNVTYSLVRSIGQDTGSADRFTIDPFSGILRTAEMFDREGNQGVMDFGVTVKAEDQGSPSLAGFCTFRVKIGDKNDNPPVFDFPSYSTSIEESSIIGKNVIQVYATDKDAGENGTVEYFVQEDPSGFFGINRHTGWISVKRAMSGRSHVKLVIDARDQGRPPKRRQVTVNIAITQTVNAYPKWVKDYSKEVIRISENVPVNYIVKKLRAIASGPDGTVNYIIQQGDTPEQNSPRSFWRAINESNNEMILMVYRNLDFESLPKYTLTIKASNRATNSLHNDTRLTIELVDKNDEIPQFDGLNENGRYPGSVAENLDPGAQVITVSASDRDAQLQFRTIRYKIKRHGIDHRKFRIDPVTGVITTTARFDREDKDEYYITVVAEDGANSDRPNHYPPNTPNHGEAEVQIRITDKNDNAPYFKHKVYNASVPENVDSGTVVISVTAEDQDEENLLTYSLTRGNPGSAFEVVSDVGEIKVRGNLDYENGPRMYKLVYRVFDEKHENTTIVMVRVTDVNDNPPKFEHNIYNVTDIMEEEPGVSPRRPKYLLTVRALDPDVDRKSKIQYSLTGQFAKDGTFVIDRNTGQIYLTRKLDRDPDAGRPMWNFNVLAHDEPLSRQSLTGYAEVRVMPRDINDNKPVFDRNRLTGKVPEHSRQGFSVLTVIATDADRGNNGSVHYSLKQNPMDEYNQPLFTINADTGLITTTKNDALDREKQDRYYLIVQAKDHGTPEPQSASARVTVEVEDINDQRPKFTKKIYKTTMSENYPPGASITSVSATDKDIGSNARLTYMLKKEDREYFTMTSVEATNTGVLKVYKRVDYDTLPNPRFNLTVYVQDVNPTFMDIAHIEVEVTDFNDNPPEFSPSTVKKSVLENITANSLVAKFTASDRDTGINRQFYYRIDRATDPQRQFSVNQMGIVRTAKALDRETVPVHRVHILAIDKGTPAQTGTGTLILTLIDVNDNFPHFAEDYKPVVYENEMPPQHVLQLSATDKDTATNGPPFSFWLPCRGGCPCTENPTCGDFKFTFTPRGGKNGYGSGDVTSKREFDREKTKYYLMPIIMRDSGNPIKTGTNTLTIIIGDRNDNKHDPGHKNIFVYNYKGEFVNATLGNVFAEDPDDWDVVDKEFAFVSREAETFFILDSASGQLTMKGGTRQGVYNFHVSVYDRVWRRSVVSTVTVTVEEISDDAVHNSGSVRFADITAEEFVARQKIGPGTSDYGKSKYDIFREMMAKKLGVPTANVQIFTVHNADPAARVVDIRYAAHGSPYYRASRLDGIVATEKIQFEKSLGVRIMMVPIDECIREDCEGGGCSNVLKTTMTPLLVNTNSTSLVGITSYIEASCKCAARDFKDADTECKADSCMNGGTCYQRKADYICKCPPGFDGPRCQQVAHSFSGNGWAWFKPLAQCLESRTSLEFITTKKDGLLLYNGPITELTRDDVQDFILVELVNGYPILRINHGSGELALRIDGKDIQNILRMRPLNDGTWHRIDILRKGKIVRMIVDRCNTAVVEENENTQTSRQDRRPCESQGETPGENQYVNVNAPLQLGGRANPKLKYPRNIMTEGFDGCIRNLIHNGELLDLHTGKIGRHKNSQDGCPPEDIICGAHEVSGPHCGNKGACNANLVTKKHQCMCKAGYRGQNCDIKTTVMDFAENSYIEWNFRDAFYARLEREMTTTHLQMSFRTRQKNGLLFMAQNAQKSEYMIIEVKDKIIKFRYNLGSGEESIQLTRVVAADGQWHTLYIERFGREVIMKLDGGEGRYYNESFGLDGGHLQIRISRSQLYAGGDVKFPSTNMKPIVDFDYKDSCMDDIRYDGEWFPMAIKENPQSRAAEVTRSDQLTEGCPSTACATINCSPSPPLSCVDYWRLGVCECPSGQRRVSSDKVCVNINECKDRPCVHGYCVDKDSGYKCICKAGWYGQTCNRREATEAITVVIPTFVSTGAILAIVICALTLLVLILLFSIYTQRRKPQTLVVGVEPDDDIRENIINYDEEGVGEEDQDAFDINRLKKPVDSDSIKKPPFEDIPPPVRERPPQRAVPPGEQPDVGDFITNRLNDANEDPNAPPYDSVHEFAYEGGGSNAGSLSSLASTSESVDHNYDYLDDWGPRFSKLKDMYGGTED